MSKEYKAIAEYNTSLGRAEFDFKYWPPTPPTWSDTAIEENYYTVSVKIGDIVGWYWVTKPGDMEKRLERLLTINEDAMEDVYFLDRPNQYRSRYVLFELRNGSPHQRFMCIRDGNSKLFFQEMPEETDELYQEIIGDGGLASINGKKPTGFLIMDTSKDGYMYWHSEEVMETVEVSAIHEFARDLLKWVKTN